MSAYHGFALIGDEHTPVAQPFKMPPSFLVTFDCAKVEDETLRFTIDAHVSPNDQPDRYRLYARLRLTDLGEGYSVRGMRGFLAEGDCSQRMTITIPGYKEYWDIEGDSIQIQAMCILLDSITGFRSQYQRTIAVLSLYGYDFSSPEFLGIAGNKNTHKLRFRVRKFVRKSCNYLK